MPVTIDALPKTARGRARKYDFRKQMDGKVYLIVEGTDFNCKVASVRPAVIRSAEETGMKVKTRVTEHDGHEALAFQAVPLTEADKAKANGAGKTDKPKAEQPKQ